MLLRISAVALFIALLPAMALANGWASGQCFVPVVREATVFDTAGNQMTLSPGAPVYVKKTEDALDTRVRWTERPWERRIEIDRGALPEVLEGFFAYQRADFYESAKRFEQEAARETDGLVRGWKLILAGHANLLANPDNYDAAMRFYRRAIEASGNPFAKHARYFLMRALLTTGKHAEARRELETLRRESANGALESTVLFSAYPNYSVLTAWGMRGIEDIPKAAGILDDFIAAKADFDMREKRASEEERAEASHAFAMATELLWSVFPDQFF